MATGRSLNLFSCLPNRIMKAVREGRIRRPLGSAIFFSSDGKPVRALWPLPDDLMKRNSRHPLDVARSGLVRLGIGNEQVCGSWFA